MTASYSTCKSQLVFQRPTADCNLHKYSENVGYVLFADDINTIDEMHSFISTKIHYFRLLPGNNLIIKCDQTFEIFFNNYQKNIDSYVFFSDDYKHIIKHFVVVQILWYVTDNYIDQLESRPQPGQSIRHLLYTARLL